MLRILAAIFAAPFVIIGTILLGIALLVIVVIGVFKFLPWILLGILALALISWIANQSKRSSR